MEGPRPRGPGMFNKDKLIGEEWLCYEAFVATPDREDAVPPIGA